MIFFFFLSCDKKGKGISSASAASEAGRRAIDSRVKFRFRFLRKGEVDHVTPVTEGDVRRHRSDSTWI